ncbi:unnamed protein product, partial [Discosporangium mesarthrocarpum]
KEGAVKETLAGEMGSSWGLQSFCGTFVGSVAKKNSAECLNSFCRREGGKGGSGTQGNLGLGGTFFLAHQPSATCEYASNYFIILWCADPNPNASPSLRALGVQTHFCH